MRKVEEITFVNEDVSNDNAFEAEVCSNEGGEQVQESAFIVEEHVGEIYEDDCIEEMEIEWLHK